MKRLMPIAVAMVAVCLFSCRSKQAIVTESSSVVSVTDTTKVIADTANYRRAETDTTKTAGHFEGGGKVEFVEGGGKVSIDTAGNVTLEGVKNIKHHHKGSVTQGKGVARAEEINARHTEQLNGVTADRTDHIKQTDEKKQGKTWYEEIFISVGALCCIALLMWVLFLYLKRKK